MPDKGHHAKIQVRFCSTMIFCSIVESFHNNVRNTLIEQSVALKHANKAIKNICLTRDTGVDLGFIKGGASSRY